MNIGIFKSETPYTARRKAIKDGFETVEDAITWANGNMAVSFCDLDPDCENCADIITFSGDIYAIEPA